MAVERRKGGWIDARSANTPLITAAAITVRAITARRVCVCVRARCTSSLVRQGKGQDPSGSLDF